MADLDETKPLLGPINEGDDEPKLKFTAKVVVWLKANFNPKMLALLSVLISYLTFTNQASSFIYLPVFWPIVWYFMKCTNRITPEMRAFPIWKYIVMGGFDSLAGLLLVREAGLAMEAFSPDFSDHELVVGGVVFGAANVSLPMQQLLLQGNIPLTMLFTWLMTFAFCFKIVGSTLDVKYKWNHLVGAGGIIAGIFVALVPKLFIPEYKDTSNNTILGIIIFFANNIPNSMSGVYKEIAFKGADLDVYLVNAWVATFQTIIGFALLPLTSLPGFSDVPIQEIPQQFWFGAKCFVGINSLEGDLCAERLVWVHTLVYLTINIFYNIFLLMVIKYGSAALLYVASAVVLPATNICSTQGWIMNELYPRTKDYTTVLTPFDIVGLVVIILGLGVYRVFPEGGGETKPETKSGTSDAPETPDTPESSEPKRISHNGGAEEIRNGYAKLGLSGSVDSKGTSLLGHGDAAETSE